MFRTLAKRNAISTSSRLNTSLRLWPASLKSESEFCHSPTPASMSTKRLLRIMDRIKIPFSDCDGAE